MGRLNKFSLVIKDNGEDNQQTSSRRYKKLTKNIRSELFDLISQGKQLKKICR